MPDRILSYLQDVWNFLQTLFLWGVMFLLPINSFISAVVALITIDLITGVWASLKNKEKLTAKRMAKTVNKFLLYSLAIILQYIGDDGIGLPRIVAMYVGAIELKSILLENIPKIMGKNIFMNLWQIIKGKIEEMMTGISTKNNSNDTSTDHQ
jgi:uncharacterized membrane protein